MITVYISIGNSDDKLRQVSWAAFAGSVLGACRRAASQVHGEWTSMPFSAFQNACWCIEVEDDRAGPLRAELASLAAMYGQDSIAWAEAPMTEFIGAA